MHFEILVEGQTELTALSILMIKIIGEYGQPHTWKIHKHRGIGKIPNDPATLPNKKDSSLLHNLPSRLRAYGNENRDDVVVIVLLDLDNETDCLAFKNKLVGFLDLCTSRPKTLFRFAIEELEAWFLGDTQALKTAYPNIKLTILEKYLQDSQCGTWEILAEAIYPGGLKALGKYGKRSSFILEQKRIWAKGICPYMDVEQNESPSFCCFRDGLRQMIANYTSQFNK